VLGDDFETHTVYLNLFQMT